MATTLHSNGQRRKSLSEQIDRLDRILDGLAEALEGAVAAAVKEAVSRAIAEAGTELMKPGVLPQPGRKDATASVFTRLLSAGRAAVSWLSGKRRAASGSLQRVVNNAHARVEAGSKSFGAWVWASVRWVLYRVLTLTDLAWTCFLSVAYICSRRPKQVALALSCGVTLGAYCYLAGPLVASVVNAASTFVLTLSGCCLRSLWRAALAQSLAAPPTPAGQGQQRR